MAMKVRECCCGCSLHTGTIIIGLFMLVCSVMITLSSSAQLNYLHTHVDDQSDTHEKDRIQFGEFYQVLNVGLTIAIVSGTVQSILNALLLIGIFKEKRRLVIIWLMAYAVICGLDVLGLVYFFFKFPFNLLLQFGLGISIGLYLYFMLVVWSFHKSPEAGYNRLQSAADGYENENCNIKRRPMEKPFSLKVRFICAAVVGAIESILNSLLLIGLLKEKRRIVIIWLVAYAVFCGLAVLALVISFFKFPFYLPLQVVLVIGIGVCLFFMLVVWSFHNSHEIEYNRQRKAANVDDTENCNIKRIPLEQPN